MIALLVIFFVWFIRKGYMMTKSTVINHIGIENDSSNPKTPLHILHISDMHLENISISPKQIYEKLKHEQIDLIALTGDFLDRKRTIPKIVPYIRVLRELQPRYGMYAVFGNHDYVLNKPHFNKLEKLLNMYGVKTMRNAHKTIEIEGNTVNIIGIDDYGTNRANVEKSYEQVKKGFNLVLTHDPNVVLEMHNYRFDYLLAGHFHGGQICWPKPYHLTKLGRMGKLPQMNILKGLHYFKEQPFYISEGLGQTGVNFRMGSQPEITLHHVQVPETANKKQKQSTKRVS